MCHERPQHAASRSTSNKQGYSWSPDALKLSRSSSLCIRANVLFLTQPHLHGNRSGRHHHLISSASTTETSQKPQIPHTPPPPSDAASERAVNPQPHRGSKRSRLQQPFRSAWPPSHSNLALPASLSAPRPPATRLPFHRCSPSPRQLTVLLRKDSVHDKRDARHFFLPLSFLLAAAVTLRHPGSDWT